MSNIKRLDDQVINQIAAGEVVERPASVLKELIENAIDAGATDIAVDLEEGGTKLIAVTDNGSGMDRDDALLAVERHATSKIRAVEDLFAIASMGFRGEALASIAAVSKFTLRTKPEAKGGTELRFVGGERQPVSDWSGNQGTAILVEDLFFNIPARRQFLRKAGTEYAHCLDYLQALSLSNLDIRLTVCHNGKQTFSVQVEHDRPYRDRLRQRFGEVLGKPVTDFIWVQKKDRFGEVKGWISPPGRERSNAKGQYFFVNQRWVKDRVLRFGVQRGYHSHLLKGKHPVLLLQITMDPGLVDVNVHPAKTELRFQYREEVQNLIAFGLREALRQGAWAGASDERVDANKDTDSLQQGRLQPPQPVTIPPQRPAEHSFHFGGGDASPTSSRSFAPPTGRSTFPSPQSSARRSTHGSVSNWIPPMKKFMGDPAYSIAPDVGFSRPQPPIPWSQLNYIGSFAKCYLMFERDDQLLVVDQHAFHERILFERFSADKALLGRSQKLLMPEEVNLPAENVASLEEMQDQLRMLGFEFDITSTSTIEVRAVPTLVTKRDAEELFTSLSAGEERDFTLDSNAGLNQHILATMACHGAVRAGEELAEEDLRQLLTEASQVDFYHNCPHGRRVFRWWKVAQVASWFDR